MKKQIAVENLELNLELLNKAFTAIDNVGLDLSEELERAKEFLSECIEQVEDDIEDLTEEN